MSIHLVVADHSQKTGQILAGIIRDNGVSVVGTGGNAVVSYGVKLGSLSVPTLNANAGMSSKYNQLLSISKSGVATPKIYSEGSNYKFPLLARKYSHRAGKDIMPVFQAEEIPWRKAAGADYFVEYIPRKEEYRVWVYRGSHLGTYRKVLVRPNEYKKIGWNYHNGFAFQLAKSDSIPRGAVEIAAECLKVLGLDFAAVDILQGTDGRFYFLEANTAPGVEGPGRQVIQSLGAKIAKWAKSGYPSRKSGLA